MRHQVQVVAICGRSEELRERMEQLAAGVSPDHNVSLKVVGFTTEMDEYMSAADLVVGKCGGLTTSEALAKGLAFVIVNPIPGQEERNADHLLEEGVAIRVNNLPALAYKIDCLLDDPGRLASMQANSRRMAHPRSAEGVVARLVEIADA
jgi:processive 1,2-diacylglycerol beta-glucosyltransferase